MNLSNLYINNNTQNQTRMKFILFILLFFQYGFAQQTCTIGQYWNSSSNQCFNCTGNTYCGLSDLPCLNTCIPCPNSSKATADKSNCDSGFCMTCPIGSYCEGGANVTGCPTGKYNNKTGLTSSAECQSCLPGTYNGITNASVCLDCISGTYTSGLEEIICKNCELGKYQNQNKQTICISCIPGKYGASTGMNAENQCELCTKGTYSTGTGMINILNCSNCGSGKYGTTSGLNNETLCELCKPGTFSTVLGANSSTTCTNCSAGTYQEKFAQNTCIKCASGLYSAIIASKNMTDCLSCPLYTQTYQDGAGSSDQCKCNTGYSGLNGGPICSACPPGYYQNQTGQANCIICDINTYDSLAIDQVRNSKSGTCKPAPSNGYTNMSGATTYLCNAGYYVSSDLSTCERCNYDSYSDKGTNCIQCLNGKTASMGSAGKDKCLCNPGYYKLNSSNNFSECTLCPKDSYCQGGYTPMKSCPGNTYTNSTGSTSYTDCLCNPGYYGSAGDNFACTSCPTGYYCPGRLFNSSANLCPGNTSSSTLSTTITNCSCIPGYEPPVNQSVGVRCTLCPPGTFCISGQKAFCRLNSETLSLVSIAQENCTCKPGYYSTTLISECQVCPQNSFCPGGLTINYCNANMTTFGAFQLFDYSACKCKAGYYLYGSNTSGQCFGCPTNAWCPGGNLTYTNCLPNSYSAPYPSSTTQGDCKCNDGYNGNGIIGCTACIQGTYTLNKDTTTGCTACKAGTYSGVTAATSSDVCQNCVAGKYSPNAGANSIATCQNCVSGTYGLIIGSNSSLNCIACVEGKFSTASAANSSSTCENCKEGTYNVNAGSNSNVACVNCIAGKYALTAGASSSSICIDCGKGKYSVTAGASLMSTCIDCIAGKYNENIGSNSEIACLLCSKGYYSTGSGQTTQSICTACVAGSWSNIDGASSKTQCTNCSAGTWSNLTAATSISTCTDCLKGQYSSVVGDATPCDICGTGKYNPTTRAIAETQCILCGNGKYNTGTGMQAEVDCTKCVAGKYNPLQGQSNIAACQNCTAGTYNPTDGAGSPTDCIDCVAGTYNSNSGSNNVAYCTLCRAGTYQVYAKQTSFTSCTLCTAGKYSSGSGIQTNLCQNCGTGSWSFNGAESCNYCNAGKTLITN